MYDMQIQQHNVFHTNIIVMKDLIILEKNREKKRESVRRNVDKIALTKITKTSSPINLNSRYIQAISNLDIDIAKNLRLIVIKKYQRYISQISEKLKRLYKNWIPALAAFMIYFHQKYNNEKVTENMKIRQDIDPQQILSLIFQLYRSIDY